MKGALVVVRPFLFLFLALPFCFCGRNKNLSYYFTVPPHVYKRKENTETGERSDKSKNL